MILKAEIPAEQILQAIKEKSGALLEEVKVTDFYQGKPIPPGAKGLTVSCFYRSNARTLTEAEVGPLHSLVTQYLAEKFGAQFR